MPGWDSDAIASYGSHRIWSGPRKGWKSRAIGYYDDERVWNGSEPGWESDAVGCFDGERVWNDSTPGWEDSAVGVYEGSRPGAAAAALILLLGGGDSSANNSVSDEEADRDDSDDSSSSEDDEDLEPDDDEDLDIEGESYDDSSSTSGSSYTPPTPPPEPPEVLMERRFATANSRSELAAIKMMYADALPAETFTKLYERRAEAIETDALNEMMAQIQGKTVQELRGVFDEESTRLTRGGMREGWLELASYKRYELAALIETIWNEWNETLLRAFARWNDEHPWYTILARRKLAEDRASRMEESATIDLAKIEPIERATSDQLSRYFLYHHEAVAAIQAVPRVNDKIVLRGIHRDYKQLPIAVAAKQRYLELLDAEHARRNMLEKLIYNLFQSQEREL